MANEIYHRSNWGNAVNDKYWADVYEKYSATNKMYIRSDYYENSNETDKLMADIYPKPSILLTPTAYDNGKLNSVKPVGGENLLLHSNQFDTTWQLTNAPTLTSGQSGYDGTNDAWKLEATTTGSSRSIHQLVSTSGVQIFSVYVKAGTTDWIRLNLSGIGNRYFDIGNGVVGGSGSIDGFITDVGGGWYRCSVLGNGSSIAPYIFLASDNGNLAVNAGDNIYIQDAQLEKGLKANTYIETTTTAKANGDFNFTRGSSATRVNEKGLIEDVQILSGNLVQNGDFSQIGSEEVTNGTFDTDLSGWQTEGVNATNTITWEPNGARFVCVDTNIRLIQLNVLTIGKTYKLTCDVTVTTGSLGLDGSILVGGSTINLVNGFNEIYFVADSTTVKIKRTSTVTDCLLDNVSVKEVGQNWTFGTGWSMGDGVATHTGAQSLLSQSNVFTIGNKYKISFDLSGADSFNYVRLLTSHYVGGGNYNTNGTQVVYVTSNITQLYIYGVGDVTIDNISVQEITDDTDLPRINYTNGEGSLLLEPQSTNLFPFSEDFTQWTLGTNSTLTFESNVIAPDGSLGVYRLQNPQTGSTFLSGGFRNCRNFSLFVKAVTEGVNNQFNLDASGQPTDTKTATTKWQRFDRDFGTQANYNLSINNGIDNYASDIYIWGAQAEELSYATSYIPTNGEVNGVTRLADVCNNAGSSDLINSEQGTLYAEIKTLTELSTFRQINLNDGTTVNRIYISKRADNGNLEFRMDNPLGSLNFSIQKNTTNNYLKLAFRYGLNNFAVFIDGVSQNVSSTGNTFSANTLNNLELTSPINQNFEGNVKCVAVFKEALDNDQLERLTGEGYETFNLLAQANNYTII